MDTHADSPVIGKHVAILEISSNVLVLGFTTELGDPMKVPIVTAAVFYDCEYTGKSYIMVIYHTLNTEINLIPLIMMRITGLDVGECPKFLSKTPSESNHSIYFPVKNLRISLQIEGVIYQLPTCKPMETK